MNTRILLVDDDESFREVVRYHLEEAGFGVDAAAGGKQGLAAFRHDLHKVVLTDLKMPGMDGMQLMKEIKRKSPDTVVVVITAFGDIKTAVEAMKAGAFDFLPKPAGRDHLKLVVGKALEFAGLKEKVKNLERGGTEVDMVYSSKAMEEVVELADRVATTDATVLILGETGTGKELLARRIHRKSERAAGPFVTVNCAALPKDLLESELFGHVKGAFTGAARDRQGKFRSASGGTIFLDEVGELPVELQPRLLRVLQERTVDVVGSEEPVPVDVRVIAATNRDLEEDVSAGRFREDLFFRLSVVPVWIPALRRRMTDITLLAEVFLSKYAKDRHFELTKDFNRAIGEYDWPGNVRELQNVCRRLAVLADSNKLTSRDLEGILDFARTGKESADTGGGGAVGRTGDGFTIAVPAGGAALASLEKTIIENALEMNGYNQSRTARFLRIPRHVLLYRIQKYDIRTKGTGPGN
ncbi:MAG: sigma-54-dependent Fis family transcriptional regulator [Deltaproteobacteria bacterium]|nr:sigma-54-dependent Fis family transcriptional regulator [Deltaproteobacteria bacterium]